MAQFLGNAFEGFECQNLFGNSLFRVVIISEWKTDEECLICMENGPGFTAMLCCGHKFHLECIRPVLMAPAENRRCPNRCAVSLVNTGFGIPIPQPELGWDAPPIEGQNVISRNRNYIEVENNRFSLGDNSDRGLFPLFTQISTVPKFGTRVGNLWERLTGGGVVTNFYGLVPDHTIHVTSYVKVGLLPGLEAELNSFWIHRERNLVNFNVSVVKCRELVKRSIGTDEFKAYNMRYAPIAALYNKNDCVYAAIAVRPNYLSWWRRHFKKLLLLVLIINRIYERGGFQIIRRYFRFYLNLLLYILRGMYSHL